MIRRGGATRPFGVRGGLRGVGDHAGQAVALFGGVGSDGDPVLAASAVPKSESPRGVSAQRTGGTTTSHTLESLKCIAVTRPWASRVKRTMAPPPVKPSG